MDLQVNKTSCSSQDYKTNVVNENVINCIINLIYLPFSQKTSSLLVIDLNNGPCGHLCIIMDLAVIELATPKATAFLCHWATLKFIPHIANA